MILVFSSPLDVLQIPKLRIEIIPVFILRFGSTPCPNFIQKIPYLLLELLFLLFLVSLLFLFFCGSRLPHRGLSGHQSVVPGPQLVVRQYLMRFIDLLEKDLRLLAVFLSLVGVEIWMVLLGQVEEGLADIDCGGVVRDLEHFVIVFGGIGLQLLGACGKAHHRTVKQPTSIY